MPPRRPEVTRLSSKDELRFQAWAHRNGITDVDHPDSHYDYRGYWRDVDNGILPRHRRGEHFPDTYKLPGHPTFSNESKYYIPGVTPAGQWEGDTFIPTPAGPQTMTREDLKRKVVRENMRENESARTRALRYALTLGRLFNFGQVAKDVVHEMTPTAIAERRANPEYQRFLNEQPGTVTPEQLARMGRNIGSAASDFAARVMERDPEALANIAGIVGPMVAERLYPNLGRVSRNLRGVLADEAGSVPGAGGRSRSPRPEESANAPNSRTNNPRLNVQPTATESEGFRRYKTTEHVRNMDDLLREGKGFSLEPDFSPTKRTGYAVADPNFTLDLTGVENRRTVMHEFLDRPDVRAKLATGDYVIGGWGNEINLTRLFSDRSEALQAGFEGAQQAVGHLERGVYQGDIAVPKLWPSVQGADGKWYLGLNHDLAEENAAKALRSTPEGRAAMQKNRGNAVIRNSQGFDTLGQAEHLTREQAGAYARENNMAPKLAPQYTQLHSSDIVPEAKNIMTQAQEHPMPLAPLTPDVGDLKVSPDYVDPAQPRPDLAGFMGTGANSMTPADVANTRVFGAPSIIMRGSKLFDPSVGAPGIAEMTRQYGLPESGSILRYVDPGTLLRDVPQTVFDLPAPKKGVSWGSHYSNARDILNLQNQHLMDAIYRGLELNRGGPGQFYPWWYNAEPILGSAIEHVGPELGFQRFRMLMNRMKPTSINTEPVRNLRNASYQLWRTAHPTAPLFAPGYSPIYPSEMVKFLRQLEEGGGHMTQPKIEPYGEAFLGNWGTSIGDMHFHRSLEALGLPYGANADPGVAWGPYNAAFTDFAHDLVGEGILPEVIGRSPAAPAQATMWGGMGEHTGVKGIRTARPTIWQMFEDAAHRSARHLGMSPNDFLGEFWRLNLPLH